MFLNNFFGLLVLISILTIIIFYVGGKLAFYANQVSVSTGISGAFIGFVMVAMVTSIPEAVSTFVAVKQGLYSLAVGGILGSNMVNIAILSMIFLVFGKQKIQMENSSVFSFLASLILLSLFGIFMTAGSVFSVSMGVYVVAGVFIVTYMSIMKHAYDLAHTDGVDEQGDNTEKVSLSESALGFSFFSVLIVICSWGLVVICEKLATVPVPIYNQVLGEHFIGTLLLAVSTSIPELATSIQIVRYGMPGMAIENISGSNIFNLMVLSLATLVGGNNFWENVPLSSLYTIFCIFIASLLLCSISFVKETKQVRVLIYVIIILLWLLSLILVF